MIVPVLILLSTLLAMCLALWLLWWVRRPAWLGFEGRTLFDWLDALGHAVTIGLIGLAFTSLQFVLSERRANEDIFRSYVDRISALVLEGETEATAAVGRAQTAAVLTLLAPDQAGRILRFLAELDRVDDFTGELEGLDLRGADLSDLDLDGIDLEDARLSGADLEGASLRGADLEGADMSGADLDGLDLRGADLTGTTGLADRHLETACLDADTVLPPGLTVALDGPGCAADFDD